MRYHNITYDDMLNGEGLRTVLFVSGCEHRCKNCYNKITWNENIGILFDENTKKEIFSHLDKSYIKGITFSGGDPLYKSNISEITDFSKEIKKTYKQKDIWLYTGYCWEDIKDFEIMDYIDILVDGKFIDKLKDKALFWRGSSNQRVIDVKKSRKNNRIVLYCD